MVRLWFFFFGRPRRQMCPHLFWVFPSRWSRFCFWVRCSLWWLWLVPAVAWWLWLLWSWASFCLV